MDDRPAQTAGLGRRTRKNLTRINGMYINKKIMKVFTGYGRVFGSSFTEDRPGKILTVMECQNSR